jgi:hypothetical protein
MNEVRWSEFLELVRKDVECFFGILKSRFRIGSRIVGVVKRVQRIINNELNPIYRVDKIPSGINVIQFLYAIRYACVLCICRHFMSCQVII